MHSAILAPCSHMTDTLRYRITSHNRPHAAHCAFDAPSKHKNSLDLHQNEDFSIVLETVTKWEITCAGEAVDV